MSANSRATLRAPKQAESPFIPAGSAWRGRCRATSELARLQRRKRVRRVSCRSWSSSVSPGPPAADSSPRTRRRSSSRDGASFRLTTVLWTSCVLGAFSSATATCRADSPGKKPGCSVVW